LSVLKNGAPDCPVCHRIVSGAPGPYKCQQPLSGKGRRAPLYFTRLSGVSPDYPVSQQATAIQHQRSTLQSATVDYSDAAEVSAAKSEGTGLFGAARGQNLQRSTSFES
jgi:hypothetical protein